MLDLQTHFSAILDAIGDAKAGLTKPVFLFVSQLVPMVNVDLLIKNAQGHTLLTWREDEFYGPGWHIPGGVIRFKEHAMTRIQKVASSELGIEVISEATPVCVKEVMAPNRDIRGHFISLLYRCTPHGTLDQRMAYRPDEPGQNGHWQWHVSCPQNMIPQHEMYREFI